MLSSNKIHVAAFNDSKQDIGAKKETLNKDEANNTTEKMPSNPKLNQSNISEMTMHMNKVQSKLVAENTSHKIDKGTHPNVDEFEKDSGNWIEVKQDLSKEPRIDNVENSNADKGSNGSKKTEPSLQTTKHVIPTFFNKKVQEAIYKPLNESGISDISSSSIITTLTPKHSTIKSSTIKVPDATTNNIKNENSFNIPQNPSCGKLGGAAIFQAFGKLSHKLMPNLVANWVTGQNGKHQKEKDKRARIDLGGEFDKEGTEPRIIAGI